MMMPYDKSSTTFTTVGNAVGSGGKISSMHVEPGLGSGSVVESTCRLYSASYKRRMELSHLRSHLRTTNHSFDVYHPPSYPVSRSDSKCKVWSGLGAFHTETRTKRFPYKESPEGPRIFRQTNVPASKSPGIECQQNIGLSRGAALLSSSISSFSASRC